MLYRVEVTPSGRWEMLGCLETGQVRAMGRIIGVDYDPPTWTVRWGAHPRLPKGAETRLMHREVEHCSTQGPIDFKLWELDQATQNLLATMWPAPLVSRWTPVALRAPWEYAMGGV